MDRCFSVDLPGFEFDHFFRPILLANSFATYHLPFRQSAVKHRQLGNAQFIPTIR